MTWQKSWELSTYITTTDTSKPDVDENIMRVFDLRNGAVFEFDLMNPFENERQVLSGRGLCAHGFDR